MSDGSNRLTPSTKLREALDLISRGLSMMDLAPTEAGKYMFEKVSQGQNIHSLKNPIIKENDQLKIEYNTSKSFFLLMEYMAVNLMKNKLWIEVEYHGKTVTKCWIKASDLNLM